MITKLSKILIESKIEGDTNNVPGKYLINSKYGKLFVIASNGYNWEHVSVSRQLNNGKSKIPSWDTMCYVKNLFFKMNETVVQFHPKISEYVDINPNVLHLWKDMINEHKLPPIILV
jgi:hypothetical protein